MQAPAGTRPLDLEAQRRVAGEWIAQLFRWIFVGVIAFLNNTPPAAPSRLAVNIVLGFWALVSLAVSASLLLGLRPGKLFSYALTTLDLLAAAAIVFFSNGYSSPYFMALFLTVITGALRSGLWAGLASVAVVALLYLTIGGVAPVSGTPAQVARSGLGNLFLILVGGGVASLMTRELLRQRETAVRAAAEAETLRELAQKLAASSTRDEVVDALLERALSITGARDASLFMLQGDNSVAELGTLPPGLRAGANSRPDPTLVAGLEATLAVDGGHMLLVPIPLDEAGRGLLRLRSQAPFGQRAQFLAASLGSTVGGAIAGSLARELQARELADLRRRAESLAAQERSRAELLSLVSHELRRPLAVLNIYSDVLRSDMHDPAAEPDRILDTMSSSLREMDLLIEQLLMTARLDAGEPMPHPDALDLATEVQSALQAVEPLGGPDHTFTVEADEAVTVRADQQHLHLMLTNLLGNAIKYSPEGGTVRCTVSRNGTAGVVAVSDQGVGIHPAELSRLFQRFSRLSNATDSGISGTGLGLYICRRLARLQGGDVEVASTLGEGTTFRLKVPLNR